jgi:DDE superfamily endonuclease
MPTSSLATFALVVSSFRRHFTAPTFLRFLILAAGWILAGEPFRCVTEALVASGVSGQLHWQAFHRFFSRARWQIDALGRTLLGLLGPLLPEGRLELVVDDTLCRKSGRRVFGTAMHVEPVSSTRRKKNLVRGHCWVVLAVVVDVPWSKRPWAVPLLFRLYRGKNEAGPAYRSKPSLAREMLDVVLGWLPAEAAVDVLLDSGYMNRTMLGGLPLGRVTTTGALKTNAALSRAPTPDERRRRRRRGARLPTPKALQGDRRWRWATMTTSVYGRTRRQRVLSLQAQWYGVLGDRLTRVAVVDVDPRKVRAFLCTDVGRTAEQVLEKAARRWPIEVWNRDGKQHFGLADSPARSEQAVRRTAPWAGLLSGILVVWFHRVYRTAEVPLPVRPWYGWKEDLSFADLVRAARATLRPVALLPWARAVVARDPAHRKGAIAQPRVRRPTPEATPVPMAA